jgi:hypothetical protein
MKLESDQQIFKEKSNIKFQKIRPVGAELFHTQTDTHIGANSRFLQFCDRAYKVQNSSAMLLL